MCVCDEWELSTQREATEVYKGRYSCGGEMDGEVKPKEWGKEEWIITEWTVDSDGQDKGDYLWTAT